MQSLLFCVLPGPVEPEHVVSGEAFLADVALVGFGYLALFLLGLLLLRLPLLGVLLLHVPVEVLAIHERRGAESTFVHDRHWLISEQELLIFLSLDVCLLRLALADDLVIIKSEVEYLF